MREFDLNDLMRQFATMRQLGSLKRILRSIPGLAQALPPEALERLDERRLRRFEAILRAMTPAERRNADLLDLSRLARIANGSGTSLREVGDLLSEFYRLRSFRQGQR